mmetsp:Transcript_22691/g.31598  ORF Transcript_22691/g.31598 Transcript_22691/m.31598 type:complete len:675 (+) Transcript_22691:47-2071(+)
MEYSRPLLLAFLAILFSRTNSFWFDVAILISLFFVTQWRLPQNFKQDTLDFLEFLLVGTGAWFFKSLLEMVIPKRTLTAYLITILLGTSFRQLLQHYKKSYKILAGLITLSLLMVTAIFFGVGYLQVPPSISPTPTVVIQQSVNYWWKSSGVFHGFNESLQTADLKLAVSNLLKPVIPNIPPSEFFDREKEQQVLQELIESDPRSTDAKIYLVVGPKQTGKSSLIKHVLANHSCMYLDLRQEGLSPMISVHHIMSLMQRAIDKDILEQVTRSNPQKFSNPTSDSGNRDVSDLGDIFRKLNTAFQYFDRPPVLFIDEANELKRLLNEEGGHDVVKTILNWLIELAKTKRAVVILASSDGFFHAYLRSDWGIESYLRVVAVQDLDAAHATEYLKLLFVKHSMPLLTEADFRKIVSVLGGRIDLLNQFFQVFKISKNVDVALNEQISGRKELLEELFQSNDPYCTKAMIFSVLDLLARPDPANSEYPLMSFDWDTVGAKGITLDCVRSLTAKNAIFYQPAGTGSEGQIVPSLPALITRYRNKYQPLYWTESTTSTWLETILGHAPPFHMNGADLWYANVTSLVGLGLSESKARLIVQSVSKLKAMAPIVASLHVREKGSLKYVVDIQVPTIAEIYQKTAETLGLLPAQIATQKIGILAPNTPSWRLMTLETGDELQI